MSRIRITRHRRRTDKDPSHVPTWFTDAEHLAPCPCGEEPDASVMVVEGDAGLERWVHYRCLDRLEPEMDEEEIEEKRDWEKRMRGFFEDDDDE